MESPQGKTAEETMAAPRMYDKYFRYYQMFMFTKWRGDTWWWNRQVPG